MSVFYFILGIAIGATLSGYKASGKSRLFYMGSDEDKADDSYFSIVIEE